MDDKKKKFAIIGLLVVIVAVGAFQFTSGGAEPAKPATKAKVEAKEDASAKSDAAAQYAPDSAMSAADNALVAASALPSRDPFNGTEWTQEALPTPTPTPPTKSQPAPSTRPSKGAGNSLPPFRMEGNQVLPNPAGGSVSLEPGKPLVDPNAFTYTVSGVIIGRRPAAVFTDANGNQRLVPAGSSIDGDSQLVGIDNGKVVIRHKNKTITLTVGGHSK